MPPLIPRTKESILARVEQLPDSPGCWLWTGSLANGYPLIGRREYAHRLAYSLWVKPVPHGLTLDHLCRTPSCVRPDHLEPVSLRENIRRGGNAAKTACKRGHPFDDANTYRSPRQTKPHRQCKACHRERQRRQYVPLVA